MVNFDVNGTWALGGDETTTADAYGTVVSCYAATGKYWTQVVPGVTRGNYWKVSTSGSTCTINGRPKNGTNRGCLTGIVIESSEGYQCYKRSLSSNFVYTEGSGGWGYHWYLVNSSNPGAGYYDPNGLLFDQAPSKTWNEGRPAKGVVWKLKNELGSTTFGPAYMVNNQDFYWYTSWYENIDGLFTGTPLALTGTAWDLQDNKNLTRMVVGFVGHNNGTPQKTLSTVKKVPYGDYMCVVYMNPNVTDNQQVLSIENKIYYYLAEHADLFKARLKTEPNQPRWLMATETVSPATKRANLAIFRHLSKPDMDMIYDSIGTNSGISGYQIISEEMDRDVAAVPSPVSSDKTQGGVPASINTLLTWKAPVNYAPTSYDLYIGVYGDPNWALTPAATGLTTASFDPTLNYGTPYVWRVDSYDGATIHTGDLWYFDVEGDPVIMRQPSSTAAPIGASTFFTVTALLTETYSWYRSPDAVTNTPADDALLQSGPSNTLTLTNIQDPDFTYYYCVLENTIPSSVKVYTNAVELAKGKIEAHWKFDGDPNDSVATWHGTPATITDPSVAVRFDATGIDGQAARFFRTGNQIVITGSETYFNFYPKGFTANFWVKPDNYNVVDGFMTYIAKRTGSTGWNLYDTAIYYGVGYEATIYPLGIGTPVGRLDDGNWHMLTATYDGATMTMKTYSDGFLSGTPAVGDLATPLSTGPVTIGSYNTTGTGGWSYSGLLDDVRIYNYELKPIEVAGLYAEMTGAFCFAPITADLNGDCKVDLYDVADLASQWLDSTDPGTVPMTRVVHWNFDETSGLTATDSSGNGI
ncbi:MAG: hypothetical protein NTX52_05095, partial [Planctomycetota bacterium]|nr:hypothetical protein [Planctomycetota bacterium]